MFPLLFSVFIFLELTRVLKREKERECVCMFNEVSSSIKSIVVCC